MKIITVNIPSSFIEEMEAMTGNESLYPRAVNYSSSSSRLSIKTN